MDDEIKALEPLERIQKLQDLLKEREELISKADKEIAEIKKEMEKAAFEVEEIRKQELEEHHIMEEEQESVQEAESIEEAMMPEQEAQSLEEQVRREAPAPEAAVEQNIYKLATQDTVERLQYLRNQASEGQNWSNEDYDFFKDAKAAFQGMYIKDASQETKQALTQGQSLLDQIEKYKRGL